jgi:hypothetical protein
VLLQGTLRTCEGGETEMPFLTNPGINIPRKEQETFILSDGWLRIKNIVRPLRPFYRFWADEEESMTK